MANIYDEVSVISEARIRLNFLANKEKMPGVVYQVFENNQYTQLNVPSKFFKDLTLQDKVIMAKARIKEFIESLPNQEIMISFSGGKDSCVLKYLVDEVQKEMGISEYFPTITAMEIFHPETFKFIKDMSRERERDVILP
jgi:3'-phosphoadenosine 5'-phosphosulfate sulfotransferase (PAPS reductase)/FAD synthetase